MRLLLSTYSGLAGGPKTDFETARDHWTVVDPASEAELESIGEENRKYFDEVVKNHPDWGAFFKRFIDLEVDAKIGEGGQAEIFEAKSPSLMADWPTKSLVAEVFKKGFSLEGLQQQWPPEMLSRVGKGARGSLFRNIYGATFIREGEFKNRYAFVMQRYSGDLRDRIDRRMLQLLRNKSHGPPFNNIQSVYALMHATAVSLYQMHAVGVLHRDIKASNVLLQGFDDVFQFPTVIDYECSVGAMGTGFWRAPEILEQVKKRVRSHELVFTEKADVYSFGMMCYEIPFEGHPLHDFSIVLSGQRPELPHDLNPWLKEFITNCWQQDPQLRPTLEELWRSIVIHADEGLPNDLRLCC